MKETRLSSLIRSTTFFGNFFITCLLALGVTILLEIISYNHNLFIDVTPGKIHSFSDQTKQILKSLEKEIEFTVFYRMGERGELEDFFERLCYYSPKLKYRMVDLERNPGKAKLYGVTYAQTVVECNGNRNVIPYPTEERVINAILKLVRGETKKAFFSKGHDENEGYSDLKKQLETENWEVSDIFLIETKEIPLGETVLVVAGSQKDFLEHEISLIEKYLNNGGKVIMLFEPVTELPNLEAFLKKHRVALGKGIIVDQQSMLSGGDYLAPLISDKYLCPVTKGLSPAASFIFSTARSLEILEEEINGISILALARTSRSSWAKMDIEEVRKGNVEFKEGVDTPGPLDVAVWVRVTNEETENKDEGELVCIGDSDFVTDAYYDVFANKDLFLNALAWLARDKDLISIRPKSVEFPYRFLAAAQAKFLFWVTIVGLPSIFIILSVATLIFRRVRG